MVHAVESANCARLGQGLQDQPMNGTSRAMTETVLDLSGLKCPLPALKTRKALTGLKAGDRLTVISTDPLSAIDIPNLIRETGDSLLSQDGPEARLSFVIEKR
jgi:tRNA 2-thiouridine synthesizing protein A